MMHGPPGPCNDTRECDGKGGSEVVTPNAWRGRGNEWELYGYFSWERERQKRSIFDLFFQNPWQRSSATILAPDVTAPSSSLVNKIKRDWKSSSWKGGRRRWEWGRWGTSPSTSAAPASRQNSDYSNTSRQVRRNEKWGQISPDLDIPDTIFLKLKNPSLSWSHLHSNLHHIYIIMTYLFKLVIVEYFYKLHCCIVVIKWY